MMNTSHSPYTKQAYVNYGLKTKESIFLYVDATKAGVLVPGRLRYKTCLSLQIGYNMPVPIPDLRVDETGVSGTLSFGGSPFYCFIPWDALYALMGDDGIQIPLDEVPHSAFIQAGMVPGVECITSGYVKRFCREKSHQGKPSSHITRKVREGSGANHLRVVK